MGADNLIPRPPAPTGRPARPVVRRALLLTSLLAPLIATGTQQDAGEILQHAVERRQARLADVRNYTLVRRINGRDSVAYYERRETGATVTFEPVSPLRLALESGAFDDTPLADLAPGGDVLGGLRNALTDAAVQAGAAALEQQLAGAAPGQVASVVDALIRPPRPGAADGGTLGSLADVDALKQAFVEGALRVGMTQLASQVLGLPGDTGVALLNAVRGKASPGELLGELARTALGGGAGGFPGGGGMPGLPGPGGGAIAGGNPIQAGIGAVARYGGQLMARQTLSAADRVLTPRFMNDIDLYSSMEAVHERALLDGTDTVGGREAWVLRVDDLSGIDGADALRAGRMTLWLDSGRYVPLRAEIAGETKVEGQWQPINVTAVRADYVDIDGVLFPGRSTTTITGPDAGQGMFSDSERSELQEKMAMGMRQLNKLPERHRAMAQQMLGSRMAQLEAMMGPGPLEFDSTLIEVRINEGPPPELVEQAGTLFSKPRATTLSPGANAPVAPGDTLPWLKE